MKICNLFLLIMINYTNADDEDDERALSLASAPLRRSIRS